jgi:hypothetical protein
MAHQTKTEISKTLAQPRRWTAVAAAIALAGLLSGCVIAPAPGYYHAHYYHGGYWR